MTPPNSIKTMPTISVAQRTSIGIIQRERSRLSCESVGSVWTPLNSDVVGSRLVIEISKIVNKEERPELHNWQIG
jgi:hypothetical protein